MALSQTTTHGRAKGTFQQVQNSSSSNSDGAEGVSALETAAAGPAQPGFVGAYSPEARRERIARFLAKVLITFTLALMSLLLFLRRPLMAVVTATAYH